jgi:uncharacterized membrane protein
MTRKSAPAGRNAAPAGRLAALVAALIGGYLLVVAAHPQTDAGPALAGLFAGTVLLLVTLFILERAYRPGV